MKVSDLLELFGVLDALDEGASAYDAGVPLGDCPYPNNTEDSRAWFKGWRSAWLAACPVRDWRRLPRGWHLEGKGSSFAEVIIGRVRCPWTVCEGGEIFASGYHEDEQIAKGCAAAALDIHTGVTP
jgi:ribosome modulation factor